MTASTVMKERQTCFQLKTSFAPCAVLQITRYDLDDLQKEISVAISHAPRFFLDSPVVIDLEKVKEDVFDFVKLRQILLSNKLIPIGIRGASEAQQIAGTLAGLPALTIGKLHQVETPNKKQEKVKEINLTKTITTPIRSGMQVYAKETDLIVTSSVSPGAELLADGNIHVYGPLRGRALAGVQGNIQARIFCCKLEAELVSIAGYYLTKEDLQALPKNHGIIQIYLDNKQQIQIEAI